MKYGDVKRLPKRLSTPIINTAGEAFSPEIVEAFARRTMHANMPQHLKDAAMQLCDDMIDRIFKPEVVAEYRQKKLMQAKPLTEVVQ